MPEDSSKDAIRQQVRQRYGQIAGSFQPEQSASCCGPTSSSCCTPASNVVQLYETPLAQDLPTEVTGLSLGCGDPVTLAALQPGQTVLDLGSGGGIDCFLAARQVGSQGFVIGVDMTAEMIERARANRDKLGLQNVEFRLGEIEHLPVADASVDVILSNCVINLSPDKPQVFREAFRVLKPGGKLAVSDMLTDGPLPSGLKDSLSAWAGCIAGALDIQDYLSQLQTAGFEQVKVVRDYLAPEMVDQALDELRQQGELDGWASDERVYRTLFSARISAYKPD